MKRLIVVPALIGMLLASTAWAETAPTPTPAPDHASPHGMAAGMGHCEHGWKHHHKGMHGKGAHWQGPLADLPKPLTADSVKKAFEEWEAKRPHVGQVTEKDENTLIVEMVGPDGKMVHQMTIDRKTGAHLPPCK